MRRAYCVASEQDVMSTPSTTAVSKPAKWKRVLVLSLVVLALVWCIVPAVVGFTEWWLGMTFAGLSSGVGAAIASLMQGGFRQIIGSSREPDVPIPIRHKLGWLLLALIAVIVCVVCVLWVLVRW